MAAIIGPGGPFTAAQKWSRTIFDCHKGIGVNRPDLGGTVPLLGYSSRCPALH